MTRAEFAAMLVRMLKPASEHASTTSSLSAFTDGDEIGTWARDAIAQASALGWIKGNTDGSFRPNASITRAEMAVMVSRALASTIVKADVSFSDAAVIPAGTRSSGLYAAIGMDGRSCEWAFDPLSVTTRAEAAQVLMRVHQQ